MAVDQVVEHRGRLLAWIGRFDERSRNFAARAPEEEVAIRSLTLRDPLLLDQGNTGTCVGQAGTGQLAAQPNMRPGLDEAFALALYDAIKANQDHEADPERQLGTSILSLVKELKRQGYISAYRWCFSVDDIVHALSSGQTILAGTDWTDSMFEPDENGYVYVNGDAVGGHAYLMRGNAVVREHVRSRNSWGPWGPIGGDFRVHWGPTSKGGGLEQLVDRQGEFAVVTEVPPAA